MNTIRPWSVRRIVAVLGSAYAPLIGHQVRVISELPRDKYDLPPGYRALQIYYNDTIMVVAAKLEPRGKVTCTCPTYPFPHRRSKKCLENPQ